MQFRTLQMLLFCGIYTQCFGFKHNILTPTYSYSSHYRYKGHCEFNLTSGEDTWTVNITFNKDISKFEFWIANQISIQPNGRSICVTNSYYQSTPKTVNLQFHADFEGADEPEGNCYVLKNNRTYCLSHDPDITTQLVTTTTSTSSTTFEPTSSTTTEQPSTTSSTTSPTTTSTTSSTTTSTTSSTTTSTTSSTTTSTAPTLFSLTHLSTYTSATTTPITSATSTSTAKTTTDRRTSTSTFSSATTPITSATSSSTAKTTSDQPTSASTFTHSSTSTERSTIASTTASGSVSSSLPIPTTTSLPAITNIPPTAHTSNVTTAPALCLCNCTMSIEGTISEEEFQGILRKLTVNKTTLSATRRKLTSAWDDRPLSVGIGSVGIACMCCLAGVILIADLFKFTKIFGKILQ